MKKHAWFLLLILFFCGFLFAQDADNNFDEFDEFDNLFQEATDVEVQQQEPPIAQDTQAGSADSATSSAGAAGNAFYKPLSFYGRLEAEVGPALIYENKDIDFSGYFNFLNDLSFSARASKNLAVNGTVRVQLPGFSLSLYELYFDYLLFDRVYLSAGKKGLSWGYVRLFSDSDNYGSGTNYLGNRYAGPLLTDIMADCIDSVSAIIQVPVFTGTISAVALYAGQADTTPSYKDFSFAGSVEMTFWQTSVNLFARSYPFLESNLPHLHKPPVFGLEMKRTIFGTDFYAQGLVSVPDFNKLNKKEGYDSVVGTAGFYRLWEPSIKIGINIEYQYVYTPILEEPHTHRVAFAGGISRLGSKKNIKLGLDWNHSFTQKSGDTTLALIFSGILPHADWSNGIEVAYGSLSETENHSPKINFATAIMLKLDY